MIVSGRSIFQVLALAVADAPVPVLLPERPEEVLRSLLELLPMPEELLARFAAGKAGAFEIAVVYVGLHDYDNAFTWIDKSFQDSSIRAGIMDPLFDDLRADPRFEHVQTRLGIQKL